MRKEKIRVLFTKQLFHYQHRNYCFKLDTFDFIKIKPSAFKAPQFSPTAALLFTSKNAVNTVLSQHDLPTTQKIYAVGEKTKEALMLHKKFETIKTPHQTQQHAAGLIDLLKQEKVVEFVYFCGKQRLPYLEQYFEDNNLKYETVEVYDTVLAPPLNLKVEGYDWLCFCSPTAVISYLNKYKIFPHHRLLCIGKTTATALQDYKNQLKIALKPSIASMLQYLEKQNKKK